MRELVPASEIRPGDMVWFPNSRKPQEVLSVEDFQGVKRQVVLNGVDGTKWYQFYDDGVVNKYTPDPVQEDEFLDPDDNPT